MKVAQILKGKKAGVVTVRPTSSIDAVVHRMKLERIGAVVVSPDGKSIVGILSERDILRALAEHGAALLELKAEDLMTREVTTCGREDTLQNVMARMTHHRIRHLPVVEQGELVGIVSIGEIGRAHV